MAETEQLTGKAKKAKRSEERFKKGKKRRRDGTELAAPAEDGSAEGDGDEAADESAVHAVRTSDSASVSSKSTKTAVKAQDPTDAASNPPQEAKKRRKKTKTPTTDDGDTESPVQPSKHRYIVFIGNLPYSTTTASLEKHFASITPSSIRHRTDPQTKRSKGFAFLEFASFDRMKTCLKLYHHSMFDSGIAGDKTRRINVELTAGGGGKGEVRKGKVKEKNERLEGERKRRAEALAKQEGKKKKGVAGKKDDGDAEGDGEAEEKKDESGGMHPSRLARMQRGT